MLPRMKQLFTGGPAGTPSVAKGEAGRETGDENGPNGTLKKNFLPVITGLFVGVLILSNILASKMVQLGHFVFDGGTLLFPLSYIFGDVLTEVYGYKASRKVIWTGFAMLIVMSLNIWLIGILPHEPNWTLQGAYDSILMPIPRIVLASIIAYFAGEYSNSVVLSRLKVLSKGRMLWARTIGSTVVGEFLDSALFVVIAFAGLYPNSVLVVMALSNYLFKTAIEVLFTPITYAVIGYVKRSEGVDAYDVGERYNPLPVD
jgi:queuosine precursor transporter